MRNLTLETIVQTGEYVNQNHFGGNLIGTIHAASGIPEDEYINVVNDLGITSIRYPAGEPDERYADGMVINGQLPIHLINYMDWARENNHEVVIVLPTFDGYPAADELAEFFDLLLAEYGENILAFEIGNEYWQEQGETAYGTIADEATLVIGEALQAAEMDIDIWVQMAYAGGLASDFRNIEEGWITRNILANEAIIAELSPEARALIDGAVEHYYFRPSQQFLGDLSDADNLIGLDYLIWQNSFDQDLTLNITEWNINNANLYNLGMRAASTLVAQFQFMIELGVDTAYIWPPRHNTTNDLGGSSVTIVDETTGIVINSVGGAVFDMMASSLVGMEALATGFIGDNSYVDTYVYSDEDTIVAYVTSRSVNIEDVSFSLGDFGVGTLLSSAILVGYNPETADGQHWNPMLQGWSAPDSTTINGEVYYFNEHDAQAQITQLDVFGIGVRQRFDFSLNPYEVIELTFELPEGDLLNGSNHDDRIIVDDGSQIVHGLAGADTIHTGRNEDTIFGGDGDDHIISGAHDDFIDGGAGNDFLSGWGGNDTIMGNGGNDNVFGYQGDDILRGDVGNDSIVGGLGDDLLLDGAGQDTLDGGDGGDVFRLSYDGALDIIRDFDPLMDRIDLTSMRFLNSLQDIVVETRSWGAVLRIGSDILEVRSSDGTGLNRSDFTGENISLFVHAGTAPTVEPIEPVLADDEGNEGPPSPLSVAPTILQEASPTSPSPTVALLDFIDYSDGGIRGTNQSEQILTGALDDRIFANSGNDTIHAGDGDDQVSGDQGNDLINGGLGTDLLHGSSGFDTINGGNGSDTIDGGDGADSLTGGHGNDILMGWSGFDQIFGGTGQDSIWAGASADRVFGGDGNDWISAGSNFGLTVDGVFGEAGNDTIFGDAGFDHLNGGDGDDVIDGGNQADNLYGENGNDILIGGNGLDRLFGGDGADSLSGGEDCDGLFGEDGDDRLWGGNGNDRFFGGTGNDIIDGGSGADTVYAGAGFDTIIAGEGDDFIFGGFNGDRFVFADDHGQDTITDFDATSAQERLDFSGLSSFETWLDALASATQVGWNVLIDTGEQSSIELINVNLSDLDENDFVF